MKAEDNDLSSFQMVLDTDTIKNEMTEDESPYAFEDKTLDEIEEKITGKEPTLKQYL